VQRRSSHGEILLCPEEGGIKFLGHVSNKLASTWRHISGGCNLNFISCTVPINKMNVSEVLRTKHEPNGAGECLAHLMFKYRSGDNWGSSRVLLVTPHICLHAIASFEILYSSLFTYGQCSALHNLNKWRWR